MISFDKFFNLNPRTQYFPELETKGERRGLDISGIKVLCYDGADYKGQHTKIYAHLGYPENTDKKVPAVVLIHGGGGHPEDAWIKEWTNRGYAAIAMDTTGYFPTKPIPHLYEGYAEGLENKLVPPFSEEGYTVGPNNSALHDSDLPLEEQWMYHAISAVILAHNILRNDEKIDKDNIGVTGISWGGIITSLVIGYDTRFKFAIPIYGSGYLKDNLSGICNFVCSKKEADIWFAEKNFNKVNMPVMWLCWNNDCCFSINSNSKSYLDTKDLNKNTCLSILHLMGHSHIEGFTPEESYFFADRIIKDLDIPEVKAEYKENKVYYFASESLKKVKLYYIKNKLNYELMERNGDKNTYMTEDWNILELDVAKNEAIIPNDVYGRYLEFTFDNGIVLTSPYDEI
ncbi:MAG: hypothetical protein E7564_08925 [Ruminococcaceae bacterium]|nr:hypothetical protein [Oscillospiraceae bacterium]